MFCLTRATIGNPNPLVGFAKDWETYCFPITLAEIMAVCSRVVSNHGSICIDWDGVDGASGCEVDSFCLGGLLKKAFDTAGDLVGCVTALLENGYSMLFEFMGFVDGFAFGIVIVSFCHVCPFVFGSSGAAVKEC